MAAAGAPTSKYHLVYFNGRGRGEPIRLLLAAGGLDWSEERVSFAEWPARKAEGTASGELPFGQMPVLKTGGKVLAQSKAIARFVAQEGGLYYADNQTAAIAESVIEALSDIAGPYPGIFFSSKSAEEKAAAYDELAAKLPEQLAPIKKLFEGTFFRGSAPTFVDIYIAGAFRTMEGFAGRKLAENLPAIAEMYAAVENLPGVKAYLATQA